jgi:hypothetical protein
MKKYFLLEWNEIEGNVEKEIFDDIELLRDRLEVLKGRYGDELEYDYEEALKVMRPTWVFISKLKPEERPTPELKLREEKNPTGWGNVEWP